MLSCYTFKGDNMADEPFGIVPEMPHLIPVALVVVPDTGSATTSHDHSCHHDLGDEHRVPDINDQNDTGPRP